MSKYVIDTSVVLRLLGEGLEPAAEHLLLAPTLIRSEVLEALYQAVRHDEIEERVALDRLATFAKMRVRYLGDKVLRRQAWKVATQLGWDTTGSAEYVALTQLQADALITLDKKLASQAADLVRTADLDEIL